MPWQKNGTPNTTVIAGDLLSVDDLTAEDTSVLLCHALNSGTIDTNITFDNDTGGNYAIRVAADGAADSTAVSQTSIATGGDAADGFHVYYTVNMPDQDKLLLGNKVDLSATGAATAPSRREQTGKWDNNVDSFTSVEFSNAGGGDFIANSNLSVLSDVVPIPATIGGWVEIGRTTLGSTNDTITVSGLADKRYYMILSNPLASGGGGVIRMGNGTIDTGSNYAFRRELNGTADVTATTQTGIYSETDGVPQFQVGYISNLSANEKLYQGEFIQRNTAGAGTTPQRAQVAGKWVNTSNPLDNIGLFTAGDYLTDSEVVVLGWDPDDIHSGNFWEELSSTTFSGSASTFDTGTFTAKKYLWIQGWVEGTSSLRPGSFQFNTDTAANYSIRRSHNGAADATFANTTSIDTQGGSSVTNYYFNMFVINNSSNEKLVTFHSISFATAGAGTAPLRDEVVGKWTNTASQITNLTVRSGDSGNLTSAEIRVWGSD